MILRDWRKKHRLSIEQVARMIGLSYSMMSKISCGAASVSAKTAKKIHAVTQGEVSIEEALFPEEFSEKNDDGSTQNKFVRSWVETD